MYRIRKDPLKGRNEQPCYLAKLRVGDSGKMIAVYTHDPSLAARFSDRECVIQIAGSLGDQVEAIPKLGESLKLAKKESP